MILSNICLMSCLCKESMKIMGCKWSTFLVLVILHFDISCPFGLAQKYQKPKALIFFILLVKGFFVPRYDLKMSGFPRQAYPWQTG